MSIFIGNAGVNLTFLLLFLRLQGNVMENVDDYITSLFKPILMNDSLSRLSTASLAEKIKGGGRGATDQAPAPPVNGTTAFGFTPIGAMGSPTPMVPGMMSPPPMMMPMFAPTGEYFIL